MALDTSLKQQLGQYLNLLEKPVIFHISTDNSDSSQKLQEFLGDVVSLSNKLSIVEKQLTHTPSFAMDREDYISGIEFAGIPLGHEFESFVLALLQVGGRAPKITDAQKDRILSIHEEKQFTTYVSLSCHNCPDVVQALNIMSVLNPKISHTMVEGGMFQDEIESQGIMAVPAVVHEGKIIASGRQSLDDLLNLIVGVAKAKRVEVTEPYDVLVIGGGPAGVSSAIYAARKGIRTGIVAKEFGGQVNDTLGIENLISVPYTEGPKLTAALRNHVQEYPVDIHEGFEVQTLTKRDDGLIELVVAGGSHFTSKTVIIATGARWKNINVPGEQELKTKGVAYCPHCDGPLFKGKDVAVIGGGNSGVEAAIDLAGIVNWVTLIEFMPELKADTVLQDRLRALPNVDILTNTATTAILGEQKVEGIRVQNRTTSELQELDVQGVFVQIGLVPNTEWLEDTSAAAGAVSAVGSVDDVGVVSVVDSVDNVSALSVVDSVDVVDVNDAVSPVFPTNTGAVARNRFGEIEVDNKGATNIPGVFAAGDCTTAAYKQIVISVGSGATAALAAFDYLIREGL